MAQNRSNDFPVPIPVANGGTGAASASQALINLGITIGARDIDGTSGQIDITNGDGSAGNPTASIANNPVIPGVNSMTIPVGSTAEEPGSPVLGMIRGNSDTDLFEVYSNGKWYGINPFNTPIITNTTLTFTNLATAAHVNLIVAAGSATYQLVNIQLNGFGTDFSGGGGNRNLSITDGTSVYSVIPAATLQALANGQWGDSNVPYPASIALNVPTASGANLYAVYSGGSTDYTAGSMQLTLVYSRLS